MFFPLSSGCSNFFVVIKHYLKKHFSQREKSVQASFRYFILGHFVKLWTPRIVSCELLAGDPWLFAFVGHLYFFSSLSLPETWPSKEAVCAKNNSDICFFNYCGFQAGQCLHWKRTWQLYHTMLQAFAVRVFYYYSIWHTTVIVITCTKWF